MTVALIRVIAYRPSTTAPAMSVAAVCAVTGWSRCGLKPSASGYLRGITRTHMGGRHLALFASGPVGSGLIAVFMNPQCSIGLSRWRAGVSSSLK